MKNYSNENEIYIKKPFTSRVFSTRKSIDSSKINDFILQVYEEFYSLGFFQIAPMMIKFSKIPKRKNEIIDTEIVIPSQSEDLNIHLDFTPACVSTKFFGEYDGIEKSYKSLSKYIKKNKLKVQKGAIEIYIISPDDTPFSNEFITEICIPLE